MTRFPRPCKHGRVPAWRRAGSVAAVCTALAALRCSSPAAPPAGSTVHLRFEHQVAGDPLVLQSTRYTNAAGASYNVFELRYYVSSIKLESSDGRVVAGPDLFYRDQADSATVTATVQHVPAGHYSVLRFHFGLHPADNVPGGLPVNVASLLMQWPEGLGGGYHFMQLDGRYDDGMGAEPGWTAHMGRLNRAPDPVVDPSFDVTVPVSVHIQSDNWTVPVIMDVNRWFNDPVFDFATLGLNSMTSPAALHALHDNGADVFRAGTASREP